MNEDKKKKDKGEDGVPEAIYVCAALLCGFSILAAIWYYFGAGMMFLGFAFWSVLVMNSARKAVKKREAKKKAKADGKEESLEEYEKSLNRRVHVEQSLLDVANCKVDIPTDREVFRGWAFKLGKPEGKEDVN